MKKTLLSVLTLLTIALASCQKSTVPDNIHRRIVGQYTFEKVTIYDGFVTFTNVTERYAHMKLQLNDQNEAAIIDTENGITYTGTWHATQVNNRYTDDDGYTTNTTYFLDIYVSAGRGREIHFDGQDATINPHRLKFNVHRADGRYKYKLKKL